MELDPIKIIIISFLYSLSIMGQSNLNEELANLLENFYAYPEHLENRTKTIINDIRNGKPILSESDIDSYLKLFKDDHFYVVRKNDEYAGVCVTSKQNHLIIKTFWCDKFSEKFISSIKVVLAYLKNNNESSLVIDLRGNKGGGDSEMELALYPFLDKGALIYEYQFKFLTSPFIIPRVISRVFRTLGLGYLLKNVWCSRKKYYLNIQNTTWSKEVIEEVIKLRPETSKYKLEILKDNETASASELYASILYDLSLASISGEKTKGNVGAPNFYVLGEYKVAIPSVRVWRRNGKPLSGVGL